MGRGVKKATETSIQIEFLYKGVRCRERIKLQPTAVNLKKVERHREAILHAIDDGTFDYAVTFPKSKNIKKFSPQCELTVGTWLDQWISRKEPHIKTSTFVNYNKMITSIKAHFGPVRLVDLKKKDVRTWCETLTMGNGAIANILTPFRSALQDAYHDELIPENPLFNFQFRRNEPPKLSDIKPFNKEEQAAIIETSPGGHVRNLFQFAFWTGMRPSELIALQWGDVDWKKEIILVQRAKTYFAKSPEKTKTRAGHREVKLLSPALQALRSQKELSYSAPKASDSIFLNPRTGLPWEGDPIIRLVWMKVLRRAGVQYRRPYQTRHTYASMMLSAGEPLAWVSKQLGHSNVVMTARVYATWIPDSQPEAGSKAVELFSEKRP